MTDIATALTDSVDKDGQTVITGIIDHNGLEIILDADGDTSITADTDDEIDVKVGGTDMAKFAKGLKLLKGSDVASATDLNVDIFGNMFDVTGTTTIATIKTKGIGTFIILQFDGACTLTHSTANLILPGAADILTAAGDIAFLYEYASADWRCISYMRADEAPDYKNYVDKNPIINGDFNSWQEGTSFAGLTNGGSRYFADTWKWIEAGVNAYVHTVSRSTDVPTVAESGHKSNYSMKSDCTTIADTIDAGDGAYFKYTIEGYDYLPFAQQAITLSFWHKHTKTGINSVQLSSSTTDRVITKEYTQTTTNTWEKAELTFPANDGTGTWDYVNGKGLQIHFTIYAGTSEMTSANDVWLSESGVYASTNQVNNADSTSNNMLFAQIKIDKGAVALPFIGRSHQEELDRIGRYFEYNTNFAAGNGSSAGAVGVFSTTTVAQMQFMYKRKRAIPSVTFSTGDHWQIQSSAIEDVTAAGGGSITANDINEDGCRLTVIIDGNSGDGTGAVLQTDGSAGNWAVDARL
jgi:hypothetical protein